MNKNYTKDDPVSWKKFNGNTGDKEQNSFKIKEWEVWRVVFEREEKEKLAGWRVELIFYIFWWRDLVLIDKDL